MEQAAYDEIDNVQDPDTAEELLRRVTAAAQAIRLARVSQEREQRWGGLRLRAERRYGELLPPPDRGSRSVSGANTGAERFAQHQARKVAAVPEADFEAYITDSPKPTRTGLLRATAATAPRPSTTKKEIPPDEAHEQLKRRAKEVRSLPLDQRPRWTERDVDLSTRS